MTLQAFVPMITYPDAVPDRMPRHVVHLASHVGAGLEVLVFQPDIPKLSSPLGTLLIDMPAIAHETRVRCQQRARDVADALRQEAGLRGVEVHCADAEVLPAMFGEVAAEAARYCDLSLVAWAPDNAAIAGLAEAVVFGSGRPAVLVPDVGADPAHVVIAWDGSRVAARAVADAAPFLDRATRVTVVSVTDEKALPEPDAARRLADRLVRRGVPAAAETIAGGGRAIGAALQACAIDRGAGLLVMGGYGHSRLRDFVLGGATRGILADLRLPVLMSH
ncbi:hypothetical protein STVA_43270 [Allostella vacuolata]|nr:hypothetical protein STVA_43270 [Stella vacuolata]